MSYTSSDDDEPEVLYCGNIKGTTEDYVGHTWFKAMEKAGIVKPDRCCIDQNLDDDQPGGCKRKPTAGAHMAFKGKNNLKYHRIVYTCGQHNISGRGNNFSPWDWQPSANGKGNGGLFPMPLKPDSPRYKILANRHFVFGDPEWCKEDLQQARDLAQSSVHQPKTKHRVRRSKGNPHHTKQSHF